MINLDDEKLQVTLKEASKDTENSEFMTQSNKKVVDFDKVKSLYIKDIQPTEPPTSNDAYIKVGDEFYFIEFKNGNIRKERHNIVRKIYDSLLIFSGITNKTITYTRKHGNYILVYNYENNKEFIDEEIRKRQEAEGKKLAKDEVQESNYFDDISIMLAELANYPMDLFGLEARFGKIYFKTVKTYNIEQFQEKFVQALT